MTTYEYTIRLTSDAEPGTGLGGEVVNSLVPKDGEQKPQLPASHIKGLMRRALREMSQSLDWSPDLETRVFGGHGLQEDAAGVGAEAVFSLSDAAADTADLLLVTRTAINRSTGGAQDGSLRTTEAVALGTVFTGQVHTSLQADAAEDLAWRLALLSLRSVGGNRNRGSGECLVQLAGESRSAGQLLKLLSEKLQQADWQNAAVSQRIRRSESDARPDPLSGQAVCLRLDFQATTPICCPQLPDGTNVIATGFTIPASAVQGAILTRVNEFDPQFATSLYESPHFRCWPWMPCARLDAEESPANDMPVPISVSLTHRTAKYSLDESFGSEYFVDEAIQAYDWSEVPDGAPLKASDGVLLRRPDGRVALWKAADMPHAITAHGSPSDDPEDRKLFTVDAMAPMHWRGLMVVPEAAAPRLLDLLNGDPVITVGKSRSVRGMGRLRAELIEGLPAEWETGTKDTILVVQSPLLLADRPQDGQPAELELKTLAQDWADQHELQTPVREAWANLGIRFGWNRRQSGRQRACRVVLPGSVVAFSGRPDAAALGRALTAGIGMDGRRRGYGAASVHPGTAVELYRARPTLRTVPRATPDNFGDAIRLVLAIRENNNRLPSPSQIRAVQQRLIKSGKQATLEYLKHQTERTARIWFTWKAILDSMTQLLNNYEPETASRALAVLANLAIADKKGDARS